MGSLFSLRTTGLVWIMLLNLLFRLPVALAETYPQDAVALSSLSSMWLNKPLNWVGSDPCGSQWTGITCSKSRVVYIKLSSMGLNGTLTGDIQYLTELQVLDLSSNLGLTGTLPPSIGTLSRLTNLILVGCSFFGEIPDLSSLQQLVFLSLNSNQFTGEIPPSIGTLSKLYWLDLADNKLSGTIPVSSGNSSGLDMLTHTLHFHFGKNQLSGVIPDQLFRSDMHLIHLLLDNNAFSGSIPSTLGLVTSLELVRLDRNSLTGNVPSNINNLTGVGELHLSHNKLTGSLPNLTGLESLSYVDLSNNTFDASDAPPWFSTLGSLTTLVMEYLRVGGQVPQSLFTLPQLQAVCLRDNLFSGTLNLGSNFSSQLQLVDFRNNKIDFFIEGGGYRNELILVGTPFCEQSGSNSLCTTEQKSTPPYSTPIPNCQQINCSSDENLSPNCRCAYPYRGTLYFRAISFSDLGNKSMFQALEAALLESFESQHIPVDSIALLNTFVNADNYLHVGVRVYPSDEAHFSQSEISNIGFTLSNQMFKPPKYFGPYFFIGVPDSAFQEVSQSSKSTNLPVIVGASVGGVALALIVIGLIIYAVRRKGNVKRASERSQPFATWDPNKSSGSVPCIRGPRCFTFDELKQSTNNFSDANDIGSGGYGKVYRGKLPTGQLVAVKRAQQGSMQGGLEFKTEIELLSRVHHKNLVSLVGFCFDKGEQMLVYEYVPNGTLNESLAGKSGVHLDWKRRLRVALGAARGLTYLHEHVNPPIVHRDIKSNNILLDDHLNAKVADFGLSKPLSDGQKGYITTQVKGTMGYLDPEYYMTQQLTDKSDVYSFGVLLLELVTAKRPIERGRYIVREVRLSMNKTKDLYALHDLLDPAIALAIPLGGFEKFVDLAMRCVEESSMDRPTMSEAVKDIENVMQLAGMNPNAESAPASASYVATSRANSLHPYSNEAFLDYSGGMPSLKIEPK
uniref:non-specific serine/threonine protein kinase n=3 Tax=Anthurium amnicola TaxID=1678845 RepID=A0A1D1ZFZ8_9ARAE